MKILSCHIDNFGKLSDFSLDFSKDIQVINEHNAWGKSTLAGFLKVMFYGLDAKKEPGAVDKERNLYRPWQGGTFGGELDFEANGRRYRISRTFGKTEKFDVFHLYDLQTNLECFNYSKRLGEELFGLDSASFKRSIYIVQNHIASSATDDINAKLGNVTETTNDINNFEKAFIYLKDEMNAISPNRATGSIRRRKDQIEELTQELREFEALEDSIVQLQDYRRQATTKLEQLTEAKRQNTLVFQRTSANQVIVEKKNYYGQLCMEERQKIESCQEYDEFFPEGIPSEEHLARMTELDHQIREQQVLVANRKKEEPPEEDYAKYSRIFSNGMPTIDAINEQIAVQNAIMEDEESCQKSERREGELTKKAMEAQREQYERKIAHERAKKEEYDQEEKLREETKRSLDSAAQKKQSIGLVSLFAAIVGAIITFFGFLLCKDIMLVIPAASLALTLIGVIVTIVCLVKASATSKQIIELDRAREKAKREEGQVTDPVYVKEEIIKDASIDQIRSDIKTMRKEIKHRQDEVLAFLRPYYGITEPEKSLSLLYDLTQKVQEFTRWESVRSMRMEAEQEERRLREEFDRFLDRYQLHIDEEPATAVRMIENKAAEYRERLRAYEDIKDRKAAFEIANDMEAISQNIEILVSVEELQEQIESLERQIEELQQSISSYDRQLEGLQEKLDVRGEKEQQLSECCQKQEEEIRRYDIMELTQTYLKKAKEQFVARYMTPVTEAFRKYYEYLYPNAPKDWMIDANIEFRTKEHGELRDTERLSQGYQDLIGVCMRLALVDAMYQEEKPFLILDDPFVNLDEEKVEQAKKLLQMVSGDYQTIYFTCHESRRPDVVREKETVEVLEQIESIIPKANFADMRGAVE